MRGSSDFSSGVRPQHEGHEELTDTKNPRNKTVPGASESTRNRLPDYHSLLLWKEHGAVSDAEGVVEGLDITEGRVNAVLAKRMHINLGQAGSLLVADILTPDPDFITFLRHHIAHNDNQRVT